MGAILALQLFHLDLSVIALIGIILLIGIVKKNAIMMIDFALEAERGEHLPPEEAIYQACLLRFRPIMMTTMAALFGGLPLAMGRGTGSELRHPLGISHCRAACCSASCLPFTPPRSSISGLIAWLVACAELAPLTGPSKLLNPATDPKLHRASESSGID